MSNDLFVALFVIAILLCGCGGGSDPAGATVPVNPQKSIGPQLRPCETTGPTAPPCPASAAAS